MPSAIFFVKIPARDCGNRRAFRAAFDYRLKQASDIQNAENLASETLWRFGGTVASALTAMACASCAVTKFTFRALWLSKC